ncbi:hypothetical protein JXB37_03585 [candidate division WOR-3 bacterium]|nr:hypothetical protein [candidate division WOR-3 bacterium]
MRSTSSLLALLVAAAAAQPLVRPLSRTDWYARLEASYDDNLFRYSPDDLALFRSGTEPARFPFRSADDLGFSAAAGIKYRYARGRHWGHLRLRTRLNGYLSNWPKSHGWGKLELVQRTWRGGRLEAGLLWMPGYLVRHYRARDAGSEYRECRFNEYLATVGLRQRFGRLTVNPEYGWEADDYLPVFDYYDTRAHRGRLDLDYEVARGLDVTAGYRLKLARARGPVPDISYDEHGFQVSVRTRPVRWPRLEIAARYGFDRRGYTTADAENDPAHAGRVDLVSEAEVEAGWRFDNVRLVLGYALDWREAASPHLESVEDIKQYRRGVLTLGAVFRPDTGER